MRVTILGTRGNVVPSAPKHRLHAGVLIDDVLLLDVGEPAYLRYQPRYIFLTHLHPDHAAFDEAQLQGEADIYTPEPSERWPHARTMARSVRVGRYRVTPVPTVHSAKVRSIGYVVTKGSRSIFYSSDMVTIEPRYRRRLRALDLVITEASFMRRGGLVRRDRHTGQAYGHAGIPDLIEFFRRYTSRIVLTHFGSWFYRDVAASRRSIAALGADLRVAAAYDGLVLDV